MLRATCASSSVSCSIGSGTAGVICVHLSHRLAKSCTLGAPQISCNRGCLPAAHTPWRLLSGARVPGSHPSSPVVSGQELHMAGGVPGGAWQPAHSPAVPRLTRPGVVAAPAAASAFGTAVEPHSCPQLLAAPSGTVPGSPCLAGQPAGHPPTQPGDTVMGGTATEGYGYRGTRPPGHIAIEGTSPPRARPSCTQL